MFLLLYRVANQVLMRPDEYKAVFSKAVFRWYTNGHNSTAIAALKGQWPFLRFLAV